MKTIANGINEASNLQAPNSIPKNRILLIKEKLDENTSCCLNFSTPFFKQKCGKDHKK
jgi:hypothetical protein